MNFDLQNLELPTDDFSSQIGVSVKSDFQNVMSGGSVMNDPNMSQLMANVQQPLQTPTQKVTDWNGLMPALMNVMAQNAKNNVIQNMYGKTPGGICTNKGLKSYNDLRGDGGKDTSGMPNEQENLQNMFINAMQQNGTMPQIGVDGNAMLPIQSMLYQAYFQAMMDAQNNMTKNMSGGSALPIGQVMNHNMNMGMNTPMLQNNLQGMNMGVAFGANDARSMVSGVMGNSSGNRMMPSSLATSSIATSMNDETNCALNTGRGQCRKPNCFRPMPGVVGSACLPRKGVRQQNGLCPPPYNRGRNGACVPKSNKQLNNMNRSVSSGSSMGSPVGRRRTRNPRPAKTMCAQVNEGARMAQNEYVNSNCQAPGCSIRQMRNGYLQCAKTRN